jgi:hypothetical protein
MLIFHIHIPPISFRITANVPDTTLCQKVCQCHGIYRWSSMASDHDIKHQSNISTQMWISNLLCMKSFGNNLHQA